MRLLVRKQVSELCIAEAELKVIVERRQATSRLLYLKKRLVRGLLDRRSSGASPIDDEAVA
jgi:hypothetical protein